MTDDDIVFRELCRKLDETVERLALRHQLGVLNDREFRTAMDALWDTTSGLAPAIADYMEAITTMNLKDVKDQIVFSNGSKVFILNRNKTVTTITNAITHQEFQLQVWDTEAEAVEHNEKMAKAMLKKGFTKL